MNTKCNNTDLRLIPAYEAIDSGKVEILSLDIFDTLLWRKVPIPTDLFFILGRRLKNEGWLIPSVTAENFCEIRELGERMARMENFCVQNVSEVCLAEVYWKMQEAFVKITTDEMLSGAVKGLHDSEVTDLVNIEVELEKEFIHFDMNIVRLIFYAKQKNIRIICVSNTYFSEANILHFFNQSILSSRDSIIPFIEKLYLSCEYGCSKEQGLFKYVLDELKVDPSGILHIGDNYISDVLAAAKEGIETIFFAPCDRDFNSIPEQEWPCDKSQRHLLLDTSEGDFGISSLRTKISHHISLKEIPKKDRFFWKYGAMILGPILCGFIHWIYDRCHEMKESEVFCLMREGKLYANLIEKFAPYYPKHKIQAHQLWVSRTFLNHIAIAHATQAELMAPMRDLFGDFTIADYFEYLGLDIKKERKWSKYKNVVLEDKSTKKKLVESIAKQRYLCDQIIFFANAKRKRFVRYLSGIIDIYKRSKMILVDVGWNASSQSTLQRIFKSLNSPVKLHGLYLGTTESTYMALLGGLIAEGYLINGGQPFGNAYLKGCFVLEQTATAEMGMGSLIDVQEDGKIVTSRSTIPSCQKKQAELVQKGIFAFFELIGPYIGSGGIRWDSGSEALQNQLRNQLMRSMNNPTLTESIRFGGWYHEHGPAKKMTQHLGKNAYYEHFVKDMLPVSVFKDAGVNWPAAYAAKQSKYLTKMSESIWLKKISPYCFLSIDSYPLKIFLDTGKGFSGKANRIIHLHSNPNRSFYTYFKVYSLKKPIAQVKFILNFPSALVRVKSLRIFAYNMKKPDPQQFIYFESENDISVMSLADKQIDFNTFYVNKDLKLIQAFEEDSVYLVKANLCCEMFEWSEV